MKSFTVMRKSKGTFSPPIFKVTSEDKFPNDSNAVMSGRWGVFRTLLDIPWAGHSTSVLAPLKMLPETH